MADIELVIKIPKEAYELLQTDGVDWLGAEHILDAVSKGTPLPEHHGRLIDADALNYTCASDKCGMLLGCNHCQYNVVTKDELDRAPTIIPAEEVDDDNECIVTDEVVNILCRNCKHYSEDGCYVCYYELATKEGDAE